jgi:anaerobic C4-dicarboxylate transporter
MPEDSLWPLITALALLVIFYGALLGGWWIALAGGIVLFIAISGWLWPSDITAEQEATS